MHFHLPKPLHGWRAFAGEIAIIVIAVLIALGAEQLVEEIHWNEQARAGRDALRRDYINILVNAAERKGEDQCIRDRLSSLAAVLNNGAGTLPPLGEIGSPPERTWYPASWDSLVASNVSTHMPRDEMLNFSSIATSARMAQETSQQELYDWAKVYTMLGPGRKLDSGEAGQLRGAVGTALYRLNLMRLIAPQISREVMGTGILTSADINEVREGLARVRNGPNWRAICGGQRPYSGRAITAPYDPSVQRDALGTHRIGS